MRDTFPYWPPGSPQRPEAIPARGVRVMLEDLAVNQVPRGRSDEIPLRPVPVPRIRGPELPETPEARNKGIYGQSLYDLVMMTELMPREQLVSIQANQ